MQIEIFNTFAARQYSRSVITHLDSEMEAVVQSVQGTSRSPCLKPVAEKSSSENQGQLVDAILSGDEIF